MPLRFVCEHYTSGERRGSRTCVQRQLVPETRRSGSANAQDVQDEGELVVVVAPREEGFAGQHLGKDAADGPDVNGFLWTQLVDPLSAKATACDARCTP